MQNEKISLYFKEGSSDKEYHLQLEAQGDGYVVNFQYGRRGSSLTSGTKTKGPIPYDKAKKVYDAKLKEQLGKGYQPTDDASNGYTSIKQEDRFTGVLPQLLNAVDQDQAGAYLDDSQWVMQQKFDGKRMMVRVGALHDPIIGINRKGQAVGLSKSASDELFGLNKHHFVLDAESIGDKLYVFDLLEYRGGSNIRDLPFSHRYRFLTELLNVIEPGGPVELAPLYTTAQDKRRVFEELRAAGAEGVVFKLADSRYVPGRPASGGDALKVKFWHTASFLVEAITDGKRSVALAVLDDKGLMINVGSVTIPPNQSIPTPGAILDVRYLYAYEGGGLAQPTSLGGRDDIDRTDCLQSQLVYKTAADFDEDTSPSPG